MKINMTGVLHRFKNIICRLKVPRLYLGIPLIKDTPKAKYTHHFDGITARVLHRFQNCNCRL